MASPVNWPELHYPLVAILRGIHPNEVEAIGDVLVEAGFEAIEVPLNSPDPLVSIERLARRHGDRVLIGAGTVLSAADCAAVADAGGRLMVSPNVDPEVLAMATSRGMVTLPGVLTPTEALLAIRHGASALKFFPASVLGSSGITAIRAILPKGVPVAAVGGVSNETFADYVAAGIRIFGLGTGLYKPGRTPSDVAAAAAAATRTYDAAIGR
ncbi:2-dehydro-3-deoxy-6-phosphogalactonate aldolase [Pleomorphomonas oryzae]|uniref:2-dehydro-3-deoxy-6-phosphogalactonate aldolase n=1 Tax=Pleomorphomonas oryzae TaxID=261934 RepID=UPI00047E93C8|nr:2-dehydro-3-deoxy-6-phosphogalactonate aldolase [Pleomorphomonas oryzae]